MKPIEIFYHMFLPADPRCKLWALYLDRYISKLKLSKLFDIATVNIGITMPKHWTEVDRYPLFKNNTNEIISFGEKIREYINLRYPSVNILGIRDLSEYNLYEGYTINFLYQRAQEIDAYFLYTHTKGMHNHSPIGTIDNWKEILDYYLIDQWTSNITLLKEYDVVGIADFWNSIKTFPGDSMSGNFWWAKSEHIKKLPPPLETDLYFFRDPNPDKFEFERRYAYEKWILSNAPNYKFVIDTKTDHYKDYCFLEDLIKNQP